MKTFFRISGLFLSLFIMCGYSSGCASSDFTLHEIQKNAPRPLQAGVIQTALRFEANQGQTDPHVKFLSRGNGYHLFLTPDEAVLALQKPVTTKGSHFDSTDDEKPGPGALLRMQLVGSHSTAQLIGEHKLQGQAHYFIGKDPTGWQTHVPTYGQVRYTNVYPGIHLVYYGNQRQLEYDFIVSPGVDPAVITMEFRGVETLELGADGDLMLYTSSGIVRQRKPVIYQEIDGRKRNIQGEYRLKTSNQVGFQVAGYDANEPLVIDPVLVYSTYLGGSENDMVHDITTDTEGNVYLMGLTRSIDFPVINPLQPSNIAGDRADFL